MLDDARLTGDSTLGVHFSGKRSVSNYLNKGDEMRLALRDWIGGKVRSRAGI